MTNIAARPYQRFGKLLLLAKEACEFLVRAELDRTGQELLVAELPSGNLT